MRSNSFSVVTIIRLSGAPSNGLQIPPSALTSIPSKTPSITPTASMVLRSARIWIVTKRGVSLTLSQPSTGPGETWNPSSITQLVTRLMVITRDWTTNRVWIGSPSPIPPAWLVAHPERRWTCLQVPILGRANHVRRSYGHTTAIAHLFNRLGRLQRPPEPEFLSIPSHTNTISLTFAQPTSTSLLDASKPLQFTTFVGGKEL